MPVDCCVISDNVWNMKSHLFISSGLLIAAIFFYILGGFLVAGLLVHAGWKERKAL